MIRIGTRGSALALAQSGLVADRLEEDAELVPIKTTGDSPRPAGDKSRFVKEIEEALLAGEVDLAVHSAKDVPAELPDGLRIVAVPERAEASDAVCGAESLAALPDGASVGTSSLRRRAQLLALRPDLDVKELRGNVDTRLRRLEEGAFDAIVLASAGLERLGRGAEGAAIEPSQIVPAAGQGCLAIEAREDDARPAAAALTDRAALTELTAERALVAAIDASCRTPVGAHARLTGDSLSISAFVGLPDGSEWVRDSLEGDESDPAGLGRAAADRLLAAGAGDVLERAASFSP